MSSTATTIPTATGSSSNSETDEFRGAATLGLVYGEIGSPFQVGIRAGVAYIDFDTTVHAYEDASNAVPPSRATRATGWARWRRMQSGR